MEAIMTARVLLVMEKIQCTRTYLRGELKFKQKLIRFIA